VDRGRDTGGGQGGVTREWEMSKVESRESLNVTPPVGQGGVGKNTHIPPKSTPMFKNGGPIV